MKTSHCLFLPLPVNLGILCAFMSSYIWVMLSAIYNFVHSNIVRKERLDNQQASTQTFISSVSEMNFCLRQRWAYSDRSNAV